MDKNITPEEAKKILEENKRQEEENAKAFLNEHQELVKKYGLQFGSQIILVPYKEPDSVPEATPEATE